MYKWSEIEPSVVTLLKDEVPAGSERTRRYDPDDLIVWWNNAQSRMATVRPRRLHEHYTSIQSNQIKLPKSFYRPRALFTLERLALPRTSVENALFEPNTPSYFVYEDDIVVCGPQLNQALLLYDAYYPTVVNKDSNILVPEWAIEACGIYVAMQAATREAISEARYRKFATKTDAGNPQQIAALPVLKWLEERFYKILQSHTDDDQGHP